MMKIITLRILHKPFWLQVVLFIMWIVILEIVATFLAWLQHISYERAMISVLVGGVAVLLMRSHEQQR